MRKVCIVVGSRANYSSIKSVMSAIRQHENMKLQLVVGASAVIEKYGNVAKLIENDGFNIDDDFFMIVEGETPETMAKSTGLGIIELTSIFKKLKPDIVLTVGDRYETMSTTLAAAYMNITIAHTMGGEVTGTIDESIRHAVTKFSHIHFPASKDAYNRILKLGEPENSIHNVGCPRIDLVAKILKNKTKIESIFSQGVGSSVNIEKPFILVSQHPVTTEYGDSEDQIFNTLEAVKEFKIPAIVLWPNSDAGSGDLSRGIRKWRENDKLNINCYVKNLPIHTYVNLMNLTSCLVGNSSSAIREGAFIGTPSVNIGTRQESRERASNVIDVSYKKDDIINAINKQMNIGKYKSSLIYGDGYAGSKIAEILFKSPLTVQKKINY